VDVEKIVKKRPHYTVNFLFNSKKNYQRGLKMNDLTTLFCSVDDLMIRILQALS
ncbi:unnamed protein product, partial [marine sediment metagenome]